MRKMVLMVLATIPLSGTLSAVTTINSSSSPKYGATINGTGRIVIDDRHLGTVLTMTVNDGATVTITGNSVLPNLLNAVFDGAIINGTLTIINNVALTTIGNAAFVDITVNGSLIISNNTLLTSIGHNAFKKATINGTFSMNNSHETTIADLQYTSQTLGDVSFASMSAHLLPIHTYTLTYFTSIGKTVPDDQQTTEHLNILAASMPLGEISKSMAAEKMEFGY